MGNTYPESGKDIKEVLSSAATILFGNRFMIDQTLYEYLIEFLLIFVSPKSKDSDEGKMKFHDPNSTEFRYWCEPKMGLRRFIFFDKAKKNGNVSIDYDAYNQIIKILKKRISDEIDEEEKQEIIEGIQDLLHGYAVVLKKRSWCAQAVLPICPEMVFCEAMPNLKKRNKLKWLVDDAKDIDNSFDFNKRNFLARGGEVYYLHILQALHNQPEKRHKLEELLRHLLKEENNKLSSICNFVQKSWEKEMGLDSKELRQKVLLSYIPKDAYVECGKYCVDELINYLSSELPIINKIEVLAQGIMFQIMRMLSWRVDNYLETDRKVWIVDMLDNSKSGIKKIAAENYTEIENRFCEAINRVLKDKNSENPVKDLNDAIKTSVDLFRIRGKEIKCIVPNNGQYTRFTLSEDIIRFLVLSLIPAKKKITLSMFLEKLYTHFGIVIGPDEYRESINSVNKLAPSLANLFADNLNAFQDFLKSTGFLRELSDATSIVVNPYNHVKEE